jgi:endonuclease VIII
MPEGDTIYRAATVLRKALLNRTVTRFDLKGADRPDVAGRTVHAVEPRGKHVLIVFRDSAPSEPIRVPERVGLELVESDLILHTHLRMTGSWHVYRPGERWQKPERFAVAVIHTDAFVAPCFNAPVVELLSARETARHKDLVKLGPDAMTPEFSVEESLARMKRRPDVPIGVALMNQRTMAGVGNVYKSEVMFIKRVSPFVNVGDLSDETLTGLIEESHRLLRLNTEGGSRRTMFGLNEKTRLWVYGRSGEPCRACGSRILMRRQGLDARSTYYCPQCQGVEK